MNAVGVLKNAGLKDKHQFCGMYIWSPFQVQYLFVAIVYLNNNQSIYNIAPIRWKDLHYTGSKSTYTNAWVQYTVTTCGFIHVVLSSSYPELTVLWCKYIGIQKLYSWIMHVCDAFFVVLFAVLSGSGVSESIAEAWVSLSDRLVRVICVCVCVCVQSESSLLKDRRWSSTGLTAASSDTVLLRDVANLIEGRGRVIFNTSHNFSFLF